MDGAGFKEAAGCSVVRPMPDGTIQARDNAQDGVVIRGRFDTICVGPDGIEKWRDSTPNMITDVEGLNDILNVHFHGSSATATWYLGLIHATNYAAGPAAANTMASHAGWEEGTEYSESDRPAWVEGAASSQSITNASSSDFSITSTITMKGLFLTSSATKGGTAGKLWTSVLFSGGDQAVGNGDILKVTYTITAARA